jgi:aspartate racemase
VSARIKRIGIIAHGAEGGALCFLTACREGQQTLGAYMHPEILVSAIPLAPSIGGWNHGDQQPAMNALRRSAQQLAEAGADFFICPNNTAHLALERIADTLPIPGLHIADVVCAELKSAGRKRAGLLGTTFTMTGPVYAAALQRSGIERVIPSAERQEQVNRAVLDELCQGKFVASTTALFVDVIAELGAAGADSVILGCTEIPLIITEQNSPLPILDSTRLLARYAVREAISDEPLRPVAGWISARGSEHEDKQGTLRHQDVGGAGIQ